MNAHLLDLDEGFTGQVGTSSGSVATVCLLSTLSEIKNSSHDEEKEKQLISRKLIGRQPKSRGPKPRNRKKERKFSKERKVRSKEKVRKKERVVKGIETTKQPKEERKSVTTDQSRYERQQGSK